MMVFFAICGGVFLFGLGSSLTLICFYNYNIHKELSEYDHFKKKFAANLREIQKWCGAEYPQINFLCNVILASFFRDDMLIDPDTLRADLRKGKWLFGYKDGFHQRWCDSFFKGTKDCNCGFFEA